MAAPLPSPLHLPPVPTIPSWEFFSQSEPLAFCCPPGGNHLVTSKEAVDHATPAASTEALLTRLPAPAPRGSSRLRLLFPVVLRSQGQ